MVESLLYPNAPESILNEIKTSHLKDIQLSYNVYNDAYILPFKRVKDGKNGGGVVTHDGEYLPSSGVHYNLQSGYTFEASDASIGNETVVYLGMFYEVWGHCLTDNIRRLWFLRTDEYKEHFNNCKLVYLSTDTFRFSTGFKTLLNILGVNTEDLYEIKELTCFDSVVIPEESFFLAEDNVRYITKEYIETVDILRNYGIEKGKKLADSEADKYKKIFLTYSQFRKEMAFGEDILKEFFEGMGYTAIAPENYSFEEQLVMFANCEKLVSTSGSCSHNCIFMQDGAEVILIPRSYYITGYQEALNSVHELKITYVDSSLSNMVQPHCPWGGPFCFCVSDELKSLFPQQDFSNSDTEIFKKTLKNYYRYSEKMKAKFKAIDRICPEYYDVAVKKTVTAMEKKLNYNGIKVISKRLRFWILYRGFYALKKMHIINR